MNDGTGYLRLVALCAAIACLGLAYGMVMGMPALLIMLGLAWFVGAPLLMGRQGWLGIWLLALAGLWTTGLGFLGMRGGTDLVSLAFVGLVLFGLSALWVAIIPPTVAARHRHAWPFGYLNPHKDVAKAKRDRLLLEEEILYDVADDRFDARFEDRWEEDDADLPLPALRKRSGAR